QGLELGNRVVIGFALAVPEPSEKPQGYHDDSDTDAKLCLFFHVISSRSILPQPKPWCISLCAAMKYRIGRMVLALYYRSGRLSASERTSWNREIPIPSVDGLNRNGLPSSKTTGQPKFIEWISPQLSTDRPLLRGIRRPARRETPRPHEERRRPAKAYGCARGESASPIRAAATFARYVRPTPLARTRRTADPWSSTPSCFN